MPLAATRRRGPLLMNERSALDLNSTLGAHTLENHEPLIGANVVERIAKKSTRLRDAHIVHISSTFYGGGVSEISSPADLADERNGYRNRLAHDPGNSGIFPLHEKTSQTGCKETRPISPPRRKRCTSRSRSRMQPVCMLRIAMPSSFTIRNRCRS